MSEPEFKSVNLAEFLTNRMIEKIEKQPLEVEIRFADKTVTLPIPEGHAWYKAASKRKAEQVQRLRASLQAGDHHKFSQKTKTKKETAASRSTKTAESVNKNEYYTSRTQE